MKHLTRVSILTLLVGVGGANAVADAQEVLDGVDHALRQTLTAAGYRHDDVGLLIRAVFDPDITVAATAALFLSRQPSTPRAISALRSATGFHDETVAFAAFKALHALGASGWEDAAVARLSSDDSDLTRIMLSGVLARAGRTEGWPIVKAALAAENSAMMVAAGVAPEFQGLRLDDGEEIDAVAELERLREQVAPRGQSMQLFSVERGLAQALEKRR